MNLSEAVKNIKNAILQSRYVAARMANTELLKLYYSVGEYISANTRGKDKWGTGAIEEISRQLSKELPGLRGFSARNIKNMRIFFEEWHENMNWQLSTAERSVLSYEDVQNTFGVNDQNRQLTTADFEGNKPSNFSKTFVSVGFTHHIEILSHCKSLDERVFYIEKCAQNFWSVETLKLHLKADDFKHFGSMPNNFALTMPNNQQVAKAVTMFKDEYLLDFINIDEEQDEACIDERVLESAIVQNIKQFIQRLGTDFCFIENQHRVVEDGEEFFVDLLFYNRTLQALVAIELKRGKFKPAYLGQLDFYLKLLDKYERHETENPSIGIILCKEAKNSIVELAVRDYSNPMGVTTYSLNGDVPDKYAALKPIAEIADNLLKDL